MTQLQRTAQPDVIVPTRRVRLLQQSRPAENLAFYADRVDAIEIDSKG